MGSCKQFCLAGTESVKMKTGTQRDETRKGSCGRWWKWTHPLFFLATGDIYFPVSSLESESPMGLASANEKLVNIRGRTKRGLTNACTGKFLAALGTWHWHFFKSMITCWKMRDTCPQCLLGHPWPGVNCLQKQSYPADLLLTTDAWVSPAKLIRRTAQLSPAQIADSENHELSKWLLFYSTKFWVFFFSSSVKANWYGSLRDL